MLFWHILWILYMFYLLNVQLSCSKNNTPEVKSDIYFQQFRLPHGTDYSPRYRFSYAWVFQIIEYVYWEKASQPWFCKVFYMTTNDLICRFRGYESSCRWHILTEDTYISISWDNNCISALLNVPLINKPDYVPWYTPNSKPRKDFSTWKQPRWFDKARGYSCGGHICMHMTIRQSCGTFSLKITIDLCVINVTKLHLASNI